MKSYKDLPRYVVLNAPVGAMWAKPNLRSCYKFENGFMWLSHRGENWIKAGNHCLADWMHDDEGLIPLPNVKIPWEATHDSVCPVPKGTRMLLKFTYGVGLANNEEECNEPELRYWNKLGNWVTEYTIIDPDYMREEPSDESANKLKAFCEENTLIQYSEPAVKVRTRGQIDLINKLDFLNELSGRLPIISDCAKAAMDRLVERWVESCQDK